jgi:hypothetical protein
MRQIEGKIRNASCKDGRLGIRFLAKGRGITLSIPMRKKFILNQGDDFGSC